MYIYKKKYLSITPGSLKHQNASTIRMILISNKKGKQIGRQMHGDIPNYRPKKKYFNDALILSQFQIFSASF